MLENIISISYIFGAFALVYVANIISGFAQNVVIKKEDFDFDKIKQSFVKLTVFYITMVIIVGAFSLIATGLLRYNIEVSQKAEDAVSVLSFVVLYISMFYKKIKQVYEKIKTGLDGTDGELVTIKEIIKELAQVEESKK